MEPHKGLCHSTAHFLNTAKAPPTVPQRSPTLTNWRSYVHNSIHVHVYVCTVRMYVRAVTGEASTTPLEQAGAAHPSTHGVHGKAGPVPVVGGAQGPHLMVDPVTLPAGEARLQHSLPHLLSPPPYRAKDKHSLVLPLPDLLHKLLPAKVMS